ncbi:MAG: SmdA family multidrug ABC transporter permease/ATP-binding protein [Enterobacteriaceae bacterium]
MGLFIQLGWYFRQEWRRYSATIALILGIALLQLLPPQLVGVLVDQASAAPLSTRQALLLVGAIALISLVIYLMRCLWRIMLFGASNRLAVRLRDDLYCQLSRQSPYFFQQYRTGDLMARATNDVDRVVLAAGEGVMMLADSLVNGIPILLIMSLQISWQLTLLALLPMPLMMLLIKYYGDLLYQRFKAAQGGFSQLNNAIQESLLSIRMIKAFGLEERQSEQVQQIAAHNTGLNIAVAKIDVLYTPTIYLTVALSNLLAVAGGCWLVMQQRLTLGELTSFMMYLGLLVWPVLAMAWMLNIVERGSAAYSRIASLLGLSPALKDGEHPLPAGRATLAVAVQRFRYPQQAQDVLRHIHFQVQPGQMLGICGATGSGKSTLLALLQRQFDICEGDIRYHDLPLSTVQLDSWRKRLAVVNQNPFLFSDSVLSNIMLGHPNATQAQIEQAAQLACVHDDIMRLPQGYETEIGERGVMLSGGQKQRIAIARALLMDAEILLLDDALSAVDSRTEFHILHNLRQWGANRTVILCAHRLSALSEANEILVLHQGNIIQRGDHSQLMAQAGWYGEMYRYQQLTAALDADELSENADE